jgi:hypothetical protein
VGTIVAFAVSTGVGRVGNIGGVEVYKGRIRVLKGRESNEIFVNSNDFIRTSIQTPSCKLF